jgi:hypothetical protein
LIRVFFRTLNREKYWHPWQLMERVAVFSSSSLEWFPSHVITKGTAWTTRVLRRLAPDAAMGGVCSFTVETLESVLGKRFSKFTTFGLARCAGTLREQESTNQDWDPRPEFPMGVYGELHQEKSPN